MRLLVQPDDGVRPVVPAIRGAKSSIDLSLSRLDRGLVARALREAAGRGVRVRMLTAARSRGAARRPGRGERALVEAGANSRRRGGRQRSRQELMIVDGLRLFVRGFESSGKEAEESRSFGLVTRRRDLVRDAMELFEADWVEQPYEPTAKALVVSPGGARARLAAFLGRAQSELLVYAPSLTDPAMIDILQERAAAGVRVRIVSGRGAQGSGLTCRVLPGRRLRGRAIVRDGVEAFVGSQGLRTLDLDGRREAGVIIDDAKVLARLSAVFEADWLLAGKAEPVRAPQPITRP
jgi:cardiolipin synthase